MYAHKISSANAKLGELAGQVTEKQWGLISAARAELADAQDGVKRLEAHLDFSRLMHRIEEKGDSK